MTEINLKEMMITVNFSRSLLLFSGIINSISKNLKIIGRNELDTALELLLKQESNNIIEEDIIRKARLEFNKAIYVEKRKERLIISYIGLAFCHKYLGDVYNYKDILSRLINSQLLKNNYFLKLIDKPKYTVYNQLEKQIEQCLKYSDD